MTLSKRSEETAWKQAYCAPANPEELFTNNLDVLLKARIRGGAADALRHIQFLLAAGENETESVRVGWKICWRRPSCSIRRFGQPEPSWHSYEFRKFRKPHKAPLLEYTRVSSSKGTTAFPRQPSESTQTVIPFLSNEVIFLEIFS